MHVEADLFRARRPSFIAEAVHVLAVVSSIEGMVARGDSFLVDQVLVRWANDLEGTKRRVSNCCLESAREIIATVVFSSMNRESP